MKPEMNQLEWNSAQDTIRKIHSFSSLDELKFFILEEFPMMIDCHSATWNAHDGRMNFTEMAGTHFLDKNYAHLKQEVQQNLQNHPLFHHVFVDNRVVGWGYPKSILGVAEQAEYQQTPLYQRAYKEMKIEDQVCSQILYGESGGLLLSFNSHQKIRSQIVDYIAVVQTHLELKNDQLLDIQREVKTEGLEKISCLTTREAEVARWVVLGKTNSEISTVLGISKRTIDKHMENMLAKLGLENRWQIISCYGTTLSAVQED